MGLIIHLTVIWLLMICQTSSCMGERSLRDITKRDLHGTIARGLAFGAISAPIGACSAREGVTSSSNKGSPPGFEDMQQTASFIRKFCPTIFSAVKESGVPLYRGERVVKNKAILLQSESDLDNPKTYGSFAAADYFGSFQNFTLGIFESGHIGISDTMAASQWGPVASIWPLDDPDRGLTYAWLRNNKYFWDDDWAAPQSAGLKELGGPFFWKSTENLNAFLENKNNLNLNSGLASALSAGHEVMFSNDGSKIASKFAGKDATPSTSTRSSLYVAVPLLQESKLLAALDIEPFTPTIKAVKVVPSDPDTYIDNSVSDNPRDRNYRTGYGRTGGGMTVRQYRNQFPQAL